jgi:RNA polymerase sigma-70 factor (ECF subfamily)
MMIEHTAAPSEQLRANDSKESVDWQVIAACQLGDRDALRTLFEVYKDRVYSIAMYSLGGTEAMAADVTQQVFIKLMTRINQFRGQSEFTTWLYRLVVNTCLDEQRKTRRFVPLADASIQQISSPSPRAEYTRKELSLRVQGAISQLKPKLRWPILLRYIEDLSYEEIASVLGCSKGTVASRLNRGHKALARRLHHLRDQV